MRGGGLACEAEVHRKTIETLLDQYFAVNTIQITGKVRGGGGGGSWPVQHVGVPIGLFPCFF